MKTYRLLRPWYKKWWGVLLIILMLVVMAFVLSFSVAVYQRVRLLNQGQPDTDINLIQLIPPYSPVKGSDNALIEIVEFSDFECPFCRQSAPILKSVLDQYGGLIKFVYRHFPIEAIHDNAWAAAIASTCAAEQNAFWQYHDLIFANQDNLSEETLNNLAKELKLDMILFTDCFIKEKHATQVRKDLADGAELGISGTPTFFVNGNMISGSLSLSQWQQLIDSFLLAIKGE